MNLGAIIVRLLILGFLAAIAMGCTMAIGITNSPSVPNSGPPAQGR